MHSRKYFNKLHGRLNIVGLNIKYHREKLKMSRQTLSAKLMVLDLDISSQSIFDIETGLRTVTDYELCAIAKILNLSSDELLKDFRLYLDKN